jgi:6-phosphogluconolactonase
MTAIEVFADRDELVAMAAERIAQLMAASIAARGRCILALSGGSTPKPIYERLARPPLRDMIDWGRVQIAYGDERCVPPDDAQSNHRMARTALLDHVPLPADHIHRMRGEDEPQAAADAYARELAALLGADASLGIAPREGLDVVLLGMGDDGHTASLFPGHASVRETTRWVAAEYIDKLGMWRITLTPPLLNAARHLIVLVAGADKAARLREVLAGPYQPEQLPVQAIQPTQGELVWMVDQAAAQQLSDV